MPSLKTTDKPVPISEDRETNRFRSSILCLAILFITTAAVYLVPAAWGRAVLDDGDAFYAHAAHQMIERGDWITPYASGVRFIDKPPLIYWCIAASYKVFGFNEFALRVPSALAVFGVGWLLLLFGQLATNRTGEINTSGHTGRIQGTVAGIVFILSAGTLFFTLEALPDVYFVFCLTLALYFFLRREMAESGRLWPLLGFFAALALAVLARSIIGIAFPLAIILLFFIVSKRLPRVSLAHLIAGILVFAAIALPWHVIVSMRNPGFFQQYFINEQFMRFLGRRYPVDYVSIPRLTFLALMLVWLFPWSAFLPAIRFDRSNERLTATVKLALCWAGLILAFFTVSARLEHYSFPALPPLALLIGFGLTAYGASFKDARDRFVSRGFGALAIIGLLAGIAAIVVAIWTRAGTGVIETSLTATQRDKGYTNLFAPLFDLPASTRLSLLTPLLTALATLAIGTIGSWWLNRRERRLAAIATLACMITVFSWLALYSLHLCEPLLTSKDFALALKRVQRPGDRVVIVGDYETANSISFYASLPLHLYQGMTSSLDHGLRYADAPKMVLSREDLDGMWRSSDRTFVLAPLAREPELGLNPNFEVFRSGSRILLCNQKVAESR